MTAGYSTRMLQYGSGRPAGTRAGPRRTRTPHLTVRGETTRIAAHEAGHAVALVVLEKGFGEIVLTTDTRGRISGDTLINELCTSPESVTWTPALVASVRRGELPSLAAGFAAERELGIGLADHGYESTDDYRQACRLASFMHPSNPSEQRRVVWESYGDARAFFRQPEARDATIWLANWLQSERRLTGDQVVPKLLPRIRGLRFPHSA